MHRRRGEHAAFVNRPEGPLQSLFLCQKPGFPNEEIPVFCRILLRAFLPPGRGPFHYRQEDASDAPHWQPPHDPLREQPPGQPMHLTPRFFARYRYLPDNVRMTAVTPRMMRFSIPSLPFTQRVFGGKLLVGIPNQGNHDGSHHGHHNQTRQESGTEGAGGN